MVRLILSFLGFRGWAAIKRLRVTKRKLERALCPIHTMARSNPVELRNLRLTDFSVSARSDGNRKRGPTEPYLPWTQLITEWRFAAVRRRIPSDQNEIDQRNQPGGDAAGNQGVVDAKID